MTGDEYIALLTERQQAHLVVHPPAKPWLKPLLEWFIQPGDEDLFTPPTNAPEPKRPTTPRVYRTAASLRAEREDLISRRDATVPESLPDRAAVTGQGIGIKRGLRYAARMDRALQKYTALDRRIRELDGRIARAESREARS